MCKKLKYAAFLGLLGIAGFELLYRTRDKRGIEVFKEHKITWSESEIDNNEQVFSANVFFRNYNPKYQATFVKIEPFTQVLFKDKYLHDLKVDVEVIPKLGKEYVRNDGYLYSFLVNPLENVEFEVKVKFYGNLDLLKEVHAVDVKLKFETYERTGIHYKEKDLILVPYQKEIQQSFKELEESGAKIYPVKTHLLTESDDLAEVLKKYAGDFLKEGDIVVIAESPVAITQGRFNQPQSMKLSYVSPRICYFVHSDGSLASPYGMESAVKQIGSAKILYAMFAGAVMKLLKKPGWFYTLAGLQSELIDDLTGTIAPYDKFIVLGPANPQEVVDDLKSKLNVDFAIADANDLKKARILASTLEDSEQIKKWILNNPAGNSDQQTPILVIRPE
ncbi:MAG: hypothetical protein U0457_14085 [Candidatus Sericytochromatia bacterium]